MGVNGTAHSSVGIKGRSFSILGLCRIHGLEITEPCSGTKILNQFPLAIQRGPSLVLNGDRLTEARFALGALTPGALLQNRDLQHRWHASPHIQ